MVNVINILHTHFSYKVILYFHQSQNITRENLHKALTYEKGACKMLMKLTPESRWFVLVRKVLCQRPKNVLKHAFAVVIYNVVVVVIIVVVSFNFNFRSLSWRKSKLFILRNSINFCNFNKIDHLINREIRFSFVKPSSFLVLPRDMYRMHSSRNNPAATFVRKQKKYYPPLNLITIKNFVSTYSSCPNRTQFNNLS